MQGISVTVVAEENHQRGCVGHQHHALYSGLVFFSPKLELERHQRERRGQQNAGVCSMLQRKISLDGAATHRGRFYGNEVQIPGRRDDLEYISLLPSA